MNERERRKLFNKIAKDCAVDNLQESDISAMLTALSAVEQSRRLERRKANFWLAFLDVLKRFWFKISH